MLHDPQVREQTIRRIRSVRADSPRAWGTMTPDQMLWHVNQGLLVALGKQTMSKSRAPLPRFIFKPIVLSIPWPKGAPTAPEFLAKATYDLEQEQAQCVALVEEFTGRDITGDWPPHGAFGRMSGRDWSRLQAKHLDHHLRQFSV